MVSACLDVVDVRVVRPIRTTAGGSCSRWAWRTVHLGKHLAPVTPAASYPSRQRRCGARPD